VVSFRRNPASGVAALLLALGCYSPNITAGGYRCGGGGACPDKYRCAADNRCYRNDVDASLDLPVDKPPVCTSQTSIATEVCATGPAMGQTCNPGCQTGCNGCGWCSVVAGVSACLTGKGGSADVGEPCDSTDSMSCKVGLYCQPECSGTTGRCYRFCFDNNVCGAGSTCNVTAKKSATASTQFTLCSLVSTCTVVPQNGCPTGFGCYPFGTMQTECDCQGTAAVGDTCGVNTPCQPGSFCLGPQGGTSTCHQACNPSNGNADCATGTTCTNSGTLYGYCM
jgi:hypothetical protein